MKALVVHGSKRGGTAGLADMVGEALREQGFEVTVRPAAERKGDVGEYAVVVVGGGIYAGRWHKDSRRFVRREVAALGSAQVWMFSSGPLGEAAAEAEQMEPPGQVVKLMERVGARGHRTFGGYLAPDAAGFPAKAMAAKMAGDWRDAEDVRQWAKEIAAAAG